MDFEFHFLRPWVFAAIFFLFPLLWHLYRRKAGKTAWAQVFDPPLLAALNQSKTNKSQGFALLSLFLSGFFMLFSLSGPSWTKYPAAVYRNSLARVLVLDMSMNMEMKDLSPDRLTRAKFKLHDLLSKKDVGLFGLVVFSSQPFVVSPLTEDSQTIDALIDSLTRDVMPVQGYNLSLALKQASQLIRQADLFGGEILVLTSTPADLIALDTAKDLVKQGIHTSVLPILADKDLSPLFSPLAKAGQGLLLHFSSSSSDIDAWLTLGNKSYDYSLEEKNAIPLWRDDGALFIWPALLFLIPVFRRAWLQRVVS